MKFFATAAIALSLVSCKSDESAEAPPAPDPIEQQAARSREIAGLLNQKRSLTKKLDKLVAVSKLDPNGKLKTIMQEQQQAYVSLEAIRKNHPSLQKLNKERSLWQSRQLSARTSKRDFEIKQASEKIVEINSKLQKLRSELPAIREAEDRITRSQKQIKELRRSIALSSPKGQEIVAEIEAIEDQIKSLQ